MLAPFPRPGSGVAVAKMALAAESAVIVAGYDARLDDTVEAMARSVVSPAMFVALTVMADEAISKKAEMEGIMVVPKQ